MFILVEALSYTGWIRVFATWWTAWVNVGGLPGAIWLMGMISVLGCNAFGTNIGATVLLSSEFLDYGMEDGTDVKEFYSIGELMRGLFRIGYCMDQYSPLLSDRILGLILSCTCFLLYQLLRLAMPL